MIRRQYGDLCHECRSNHSATLHGLILAQQQTVFGDPARAGVKAPHRRLLEWPLALLSRRVLLIGALLLRQTGLGATLQTLPTGCRQRGAFRVERLENLPRLLVQQAAACAGGAQGRVVLQLVVLAGNIRIDIGGWRRKGGSSSDDTTADTMTATTDGVAAAAADGVATVRMHLLAFLQTLFLGLFLPITIIVAVVVGFPLRAILALLLLQQHALLLAFEPSERRLTPRLGHDKSRGGLR